MMGLSPDQIETYLRDGILVVPNILTSSEVQNFLTGLRDTLWDYAKVDLSNIGDTGHNLKKLSSTNGSGGVLDIFYPPWKLDVATNESLFWITTQLWKAAHFHSEQQQDEPLADDDEYFKWHPYGPFDCNTGFIYLDRIGYRLPSSVAEDLGRSAVPLNRQQQQDVKEESHGDTKGSVGQSWQKRIRTNRSKPIQRSLTPHLDCCPYNYRQPSSSTTDNNAKKWRPIQCLVSLTSNLYPNTGGFEAVPGFHRTFHYWAKNRSPTILQRGKKVQAPCVGEYTHIRPVEDKEVLEKIQHLPVPAGAAVFWDNRIPHANAYRNDGYKQTNDDKVTEAEARAVVYCSFLPNVELNRRYAARQLEDWKKRRVPRDQWIDIDGKKECMTAEEVAIATKRAVDDEYCFTELGRKLMSIDPW